MLQRCRVFSPRYLCEVISWLVGDQRWCRVFYFKLLDTRLDRTPNYVKLFTSNLRLDLETFVWSCDLRAFRTFVHLFGLRSINDVEIDSTPSFLPLLLRNKAIYFLLIVQTDIFSYKVRTTPHYTAHIIQFPTRVSSHFLKVLGGFERLANMHRRLTFSFSKILHLYRNYI